MTSPDNTGPAWRRQYKDPDQHSRDVAATNTARRKRRQTEWFQGKTCTYCGSCDNLTVDHIDPSGKDPALRGHGASKNIWLMAYPRMLAELAKCQPLCKTCHYAKSGREKTRTHHRCGRELSVMPSGKRCAYCDNERRRKR